MVLSNTKPSTWTLSPQMTAAPGLWRGVVSAADIDGPMPFDIISRSFMVNAGAAQAMGLAGKCAFISETDNVITAGRNIMPSAGPMTLHAVFEATVQPSTFKGFVSNFNSVSASIADPYIGIDTTDSRIRCFWSSFEFVNGETVSLNTPHVVTATFDPGNEIRLFYDGQDQGSDSARSIPIRDRETDIGTIKQAQGYEFPGYIYFTAVWDRILDPSEIKVLARDRFIMLRPSGF